MIPNLICLHKIVRFEISFASIKIIATKISKISSFYFTLLKLGSNRYLLFNENSHFAMDFF